MRRLLLPLWLCLLPTAPREEEIAYGLEAGDELLRTFTAHASYERDGMTAELDGEEREVDPELLPSLSIESVETVVARDVVAEVQDGRPVDFRRTFEELTQEATWSLAFEDQQEEHEGDDTSDLEGVTVRFVWDEEDEAYWVEFDDPEEPLDAEVLDWLTPDMDLAGLLPDEPVEPGDSWDVDGAAYLTLMWPGGLVGWYDPEEQVGPDPFYAAQNRQIVENLTGEGTVTFLEVREVEGARVAALAVELEIETSSEGENEDGHTITVEMERSLEGEVLWDLERGHLASATFDTDSSWSRAEAAEIEDPEGGLHDAVQTEFYEGEIRYEVRVERE